MRRGEFASLTRLGEATLARWEAGTTLQNAAYDKYLRLLQVRENVVRLSASPAQEVTRELPANVLRFRKPRLRAIEDVPVELARAAQAFQLHR
jgi:hypothetical protein